MSETTALHQWANQGKSAPDESALATERDISGGLDSGFEDSQPFEDEADLRAERSAVEPEEAPGATSKAAKNRKLMVIGGAVLGLVLIGGAYKRSLGNSAQMQIAAAQDNAAELQAPVHAAPVAQPLVVDQPEAAASAVALASSLPAVTPPVFGTPASAVAPTAVAPAAVAPARPTAPAQLPQQAAEVSSDQAGRIAELTHRLSANEAAQRQQTDLLLAEIKALKSQIASVAEVAKAKPAATTRAPAAPVVVQQAPKPAPAKKEPEVAQAPVEQPPKAAPQVEAKPAAQQAKGKVRTDYRIYAVVEGRVWVRSLDSQSEAEVVDSRSRLADGSTVIEVRANGNEGVVVTSKGEIR